MTAFVWKGSAVISPCQQYRYVLSRERPLSLLPDGAIGRLIYIMLNPSTADAYANDRTITKIWRGAVTDGYVGLDVVNLFAWRATDPAELAVAADPVGPDNDEAIERVLEAAMKLERYQVVCAWGAKAIAKPRAKLVTAKLLEMGIEPRYLRLTQDGSPEHPLYLPNRCKPTRWSEARGYASC